jgi:hypothetical protein
MATLVANRSARVPKVSKTETFYVANDRWGGFQGFFEAKERARKALGREEGTVKKLEVEFRGDHFKVIYVQPRKGLSRHTLGWPRSLKEWSESSFGEWEYSTRDKAFEKAALENTDTKSSIYAVVIEIGVSVGDRQWVTNPKIDGRLGEEEVFVVRPFRLCMPTRDEVKRFAKPIADGKAGAQ